MKGTLYTSVLALLMACAAPQTASGPAGAASSREVNPTNPSITLAEYLKRVPGVQVIDRSGRIAVTIRGASSVANDIEPLFVINGVNVGFGYEHAAPLVDVSDIENVQVLKSGSETARYGMQGNNGVIVIKTKRR